MKKINFVTIVFVLCSATFAEAEWINLGVGSAICQSQLYDPSTIKKSGNLLKNYRTVWSKCVKPIGPRADLKVFTSLHEIDCRNNKQRILQSQDVPLDSTKSTITNTTPEPWFFLAPGTVGEALMKKACK